MLVLLFYGFIALMVGVVLFHFLKSYYFLFKRNPVLCILALSFSGLCFFIPHYSPAILLFLVINFIFTAYAKHIEQTEKTEL